jgi:hypothetical protein
MMKVAILDHDELTGNMKRCVPTEAPPALVSDCNLQ